MKSFLLSIVLTLAGSTVAQTISTFPYNEDFEGEGASTACSGYIMAIPGWLNDPGDDNDWAPDAGGTGSFGTGPGVDFNPGTFTGKYMYTETSGCNGNIDIILCIPSPVMLSLINTLLSKKTQSRL